MLGRGRSDGLRVALNGRRSRGGSFGRGSEKKRTRFPDGACDVRNAEGRVGFCAGRFGSDRAGAESRGAKNPVARVGSSASTGDEGAGAATVGSGVVARVFDSEDVCCGAGRAATGQSG